MADAYKGLTIKLGGDASSLSRALTTVSRAATETQSKLRMMSRALKVDPSSSAAMARSIKFINQQAETAGSKLKKLQASISDLGKQHVAIFDPKTGERMTGTVAELAKKTQNVALTAEQARSAYNEVDAALDNIYRSIKKSSGIDLRDSTNAEVERLSLVGKITAEQAQKVLQLRDAWHEADAALQGSKKLVKFERMGADIESVKSNIKGFAAQLIALDSQSSVAKQNKSFADLDTKILSCDNALKTLQQRGKMIDEAIKFDPSNVGLVAEKIKNLKDQQDAAAQKADALKAKMASYPTSMIHEAANAQKNWALEIEQTRNAYSKAQGELKSAEGELAALVERQKQLKLLGDTQGAAKMQAEIEETRTKVASLGVEAKEAYRKFDTAKACNELQQLTNETQEATQESSRLSKAIKQVGKIHFEDFGKLRQLGATLKANVTSPIVNLARNAQEAAREVDSAFRDMKKTVQGTPEQFQDLKKSAMEFSTTHVTSPSQILEIEAMGGQLGVSADKLKKFAEVASNLDIATNIDSQEIAKSMGQLSNILDDLNHDNLDQFADALVRLGNNLPTQESSILEVTNRIGSMGSIVGMTTPEILAWAGAIASTGQGTESAGTAISRTMSQIEGAVAGASGAFDLSEQAISEAVAVGGAELEEFAALAGMTADEFVDAWSSDPQSVLENLTKELGSSSEKLEAFAKVSGVSAEEFASKWKSSPSDALKLFVGGLKQIKDDGGSVDKTLGDLGITSVRQKQALEGLVQTFGTLDNALTMSSDAWNNKSDQWGDAGDAAREAEQKAEGFSGALAKLQNIAMAAGAVLGDAVTPMLNNMVDVAGDALSVFSNMDPAIQTGIVGFAGLAASAAPAINVIGGVGQGTMSLSRGTMVAARTMRELSTNSGTLTGALTSAMEATGGFENAAESAGSIVGGLKAGLVGLAIAGVAFLAAKVIEAKAKQDAYNNAMDSLDSTIDGMHDNLKAGSRAIDDIGNAAARNAPTVEELTKDLGDFEEKIKQITKPAEEQNRVLGQAKTIIDEWAGKGKVAADKAGELQWAVDTLNGILGENYKVQDILNGTYEDAEGKAHSYREEIDKLIESKQREIELKAYEDVYSESLKQKVKGEQDKQLAQENYDKKVDETKKKYMDGTYATYDEKKATEVAKASLQGSDEDKELKEATENYKEYAKAVDIAKQEMNDINHQNNAQKLAEEIKGIDGIVNALDKAGIGIDDFAASMEKAGVSTETLKSIGVDNFKKLANSVDGNTDEMASRLKALDALGIDPKNITVNDDGTISLATGEIIDLNNMSIDGKKFYIDDDGTAKMAAKDIEKVNKKNVKDKQFKISALTGTALDKIRAVQAKIDNLHDKNIKITATGVAKNLSGKLVPHIEMATGGIRYHADGMIVDRPTWIGHKDIAGEAGAEAIIPLTNKRYVSPFAGSVAEEFIAKMNDMRSSSDTTGLDSSLIGAQIADSLNGAQVVLNGNVVGSLMVGASRRAAMYLG
ncbi:phage tail tape measure protein [uncultured Olegusella sp.]|uniref:phage tail tape measure protein n=1 Tax=uncultured Olegusella sp. TaxID=1979846 RepID=UPI002602FB70|nr:phage tail tape measure protein [uncultured Olegusella sp.]